MMMEHTNYPPEELVPIVAELAAKYAGFEHSSIPYEKAQMLMGAVLYCIHECNIQECNNHKCETIDYSGLSDMPKQPSASLPVESCRLPAKEAYRKGRQIILEKMEELRKLYNRLITDFDAYGSKYLHDAIVKAIPSFLLKYDAEYAPQETLITFDYPILNDISTATGIDAVLAYVEGIFPEQRFLKPFGAPYVMEILSAYHEDYDLLPENLCTIVLQNTIGHIMLGKPLQAKGFLREEYAHMEQLLSGKSDTETVLYIDTLLKALIRQYYENDFLLSDYLKHDVPNIAKRLQIGAENHCLEKMIWI